MSKRRITHPNSHAPVIQSIGELIAEAAPLSRTLRFSGEAKAMASRRAAIYHYRTSVRQFLANHPKDPRNSALAEILRPQLAALELISMELHQEEAGMATLNILFPGSPDSKYADELSQIEEMRRQLRAEKEAMDALDEPENPGFTDFEKEPVNKDESQSTFTMEEAFATPKESVLTEAEQHHVDNVLSGLGITPKRKR